VAPSLKLGLREVVVHNLLILGLCGPLLSAKFSTALELSWGLFYEQTGRIAGWHPTEGLQAKKSLWCGTAREIAKHCANE
jgi:hypothetical protein